MKKRILSILLAAIMVCSLLPVSAFAAVTSLGNVTFTVEANEDAGLGGDVKISFTRSGSNYSGTLYLPGSADTGKLALSWDEGMTVSGCTSGETAIPANGESATYSVTVGGSTANYTIKTMQGSAGVEGMFLNIDESLGTIAAMLGDQNHEETCYGNLSLDGESYDMSIKGRGNSSWTFNFDKKPFNITLYKDEDVSKEVAKYSDKKKAELIDGVEAKKWTILANAKDSSLLRNKIGYDIALAMGLGVDNRFIDVWMNGEYLGNYLLTPKTDTVAPKNGYQIELERRIDNEDPQFTLKGFENGTRPIYFTVKDNGADAETADIKAYMQKVADAILDTKSSDYLNYIDLDSWAKMYLLNELYKDVDVVTDSIFMYRNGTDDSDKLYAGPIWDLDGAIGRTYSNGYCGVDNTNQISPDKWYIDGIQYDNNRGYLSWFQMLGRHQEFMQRVYELYNEYVAEFDALEAQITEQAVVIADSANMNFNIHPVNQTVERMFNVESTKSVGSGTYKITYKVTNSWSDYVDNLKKFVTARNAFFSDNLTVSAPAGSISGNTNYAAGDGLTLTADCTADGYQWQSSADGENWADIAGATAKTYSATALYTMNGLSVRCVAKNVGSAINTTRVAKVAPAASTVLAPVTLIVSLEGHEHNYQSVVTAPTCTEQGYTTHTCACGDSFADTYTDALEHNFADGKCTRCKAKDPAYIPQCVVNKSVSLSEGTFSFTLGGQNLGEYTFARSGNNWTIKDSDGKYLGFANNALSDNAFGWTYSNGRFQTTVTTTTPGGNTGWGWGFGFFGFGGFGGGSRTTTTTYYLVYTNGRIAVSTNTSGANAGFTKYVENLTHTFGAWAAQNGVHTRTCTVCGAEEQGECSFGAWTAEDGVHHHTCTVCNVEAQGECTYDDWKPDENGKHSRICSVCGEKAYEACSYVDHECSVCGRAESGLTYVTAAFVTGEGASAAPAAQTVIAGEGLITEPESDPTRIGFLFDGWYVDSTAFTFNTTINSDVTITAKWTECNDHDFDENHICSRCGAKDPEAEAHCSGDKAVSLTTGELLFTLGGQNLGAYTFTRSGNNWTIKDSDGKYLGFANNALSDNAFGWTYSNGRFQTTVTTTTPGGSTGWGWGWGWGFGGWGFGGGSRTTTTTYYLACVNGNITVSTGANGANAVFKLHVESDEHSGTWKTVGKTHTRICTVCGTEETEPCNYGADHRCTVCGSYDPDYVVVNVSVSKSQRTSGGNSGWGWSWGFGGWGGSSRTTTYTATITATATGTTVRTVQYSTNNGASWTSGSTVTSGSQIGTFLIRVTDGNANLHNFKYENGTVVKVD